MEPRPSATLTPRLPAPLFVGEGEGEEGEDAAPVAFVPLRVLARSWNAVKLRSESWTGLTAKTIPAPQCDEPSGLCCLHYTSYQHGVRDGN